jgi:hypothetical protein
MLGERGLGPIGGPNVGFIRLPQPPHPLRARALCRPGTDALCRPSLVVDPPPRQPLATKHESRIAPFRQLPRRHLAVVDDERPVTLTLQSAKSALRSFQQGNFSGYLGALFASRRREPFDKTPSAKPALCLPWKGITSVTVVTVPLICFACYASCASWREGAGR